MIDYSLDPQYFMNRELNARRWEGCSGSGVSSSCVLQGMLEIVRDSPKKSQ